MAAGGACEQLSRLSLEAAIRDKYCSEGEDERDTQTAHKDIKESAIAFRPGSYPVQRRSTIVLDQLGGVTHVGTEEELAELCPRAEELQLAANLISDWADVCSILSSLPKLLLLDLSRNPLHSPSFAPPHPTNTTITTLILNSTHIAWGALQVCLQALPSLQELHLSENGYSRVSLSPSFHHLTLRCLYANSNHLADWRELENLSNAFPNLKTLVATALPLSEVPPVSNQAFPELTSLSLSGCRLSRWESLEHLTALPKLTDLRMAKVPLGEELDDKQRRKAIIAQMPGLKLLNKSDINDMEREDAERWLLRRYENEDRRPAIYASLVARHGSPIPLAEVDLAPRLEVQVEFQVEDRQNELHSIKLRQSTRQFRQWISKQFGLTPGSFRVWCVDTELENEGFVGKTEMRLDTKKLYSYHISDKDRIIVQMKFREGK